MRPARRSGCRRCGCNGILEEADVISVDALKIDVEGYEDRVLTGFFKQAPQTLWPRAVVIEHLSKNEWQDDCIADMIARGYRHQRQDPQQHHAGARLKNVICAGYPGHPTLRRVRACPDGHNIEAVCHASRRFHRPADRELHAPSPLSPSSWRVRTRCRSSRPKFRRQLRARPRSRRREFRPAIPIPKFRRPCASPAHRHSPTSLPGKMPDEVPTRGPSGPRTPNPATDTAA